MFHKIRWTVGGEGLHKYQIWYKKEDGAPYHTCSVGWCRRLFALYRRTGGGLLSSFIFDDSSAYVTKLLFLLSVCYERGFGLRNKSQVLIPALLLSRFSRVRLCDPIDGSPLGSSVPGILQARTLEWVAISFSNALKRKVNVKSLSRVWLLVPLSMGFSRQENWSGISCIVVSICRFKSVK